jgi:hypothetical protein
MPQMSTETNPGVQKPREGDCSFFQVAVDNREPKILCRVTGKTGQESMRLWCPTQTWSLTDNNCRLLPGKQLSADIQKNLRENSNIPENPPRRQPFK